MNRNKQLITIITVTYNAEKFLERTIKSVAEQDYKNIEYIIIDGGSSDGTIDIIKRYEKYISYWVSGPDGGVFYAMNNGVKLANGEWINFLNAGDTYVKASTLTDIFTYTQTNTDILLSHTNIVDAETNQITDVYKANLDAIYSNTPCFHQAQFVKRSILNKHPYNTKYKIVCDYDLMIYCFLNNSKFQVVDLIAVNYLSGGMSSVHAEESMLEAMMILKEYNIDYEKIADSYWMKALLVRHKNADDDSIKFSAQFNQYTKQLEFLSNKYDKIAIYGYGVIGKNIHLVLGDKISLIYDKKFPLSNTTRSNLLHPTKLKRGEFNIIIISVLGREEEIKNYLIKECNLNSEIIFTFSI